MFSTVKLTKQSMDFLILPILLTLTAMKFTQQASHMQLFENSTIRQFAFTHRTLVVECSKSKLSLRKLDHNSALTIFSQIRQKKTILELLKLVTMFDFKLVFQMPIRTKRMREALRF